MPDHKKIYQQDAIRYQRLVAREDYQDNLLPAIERIISVIDLDVVDLGAGTGRLTNLLAPYARSIFALDRSHHMLGVAADRLQDQAVDNWLVAAADHRGLPLPENSVDLVISGWSFCYLAVWGGENWREQVDQGIREIKRVLRREGKIIIIESLGTGTKDPEEPDKLKGYFSYLENLGFQRTWIRTDYQFDHREEALELTEFFFGEEMLDNIGSEKSPVLPECTGIWWFTQETNSALTKY
jgi:ubiquinone/menaquinone biosynthesis C-methylase UbiE